MLKKIKFMRRMDRLMRACGGNLNNPSKADTIVATIILFPLHDDKNKKELPFCNKYVLADAAVIEMVYALVYSGNGNDMAFIKECMTKLYAGVCEMYDVDQEAFLDITQNRIGFFEPIIRYGDIEKFTSEAIILFMQDIVNNKFVPFGEDSPLPILDFDKHMQIEIHTKAHFIGLLPLLSK